MKPDISLIPEPDKSTAVRKPLTKKQRAEMLLSQNGYCGCGCGVKVDHVREGSVDEHMDPLALTGTNDLENRKIFRKPCAADKTKNDFGNIARAKRMGGEKGQVFRRQKRGHGLIKSAGFQKPAFKKPWPKRSFNTWEKT